MIGENLFCISHDTVKDLIDSRIYGYAFYKGTLYKNAAVNSENITNLFSDETVGCFTLIYNDINCLKISSGVLGRQNIFYYTLKGKWIISNSFLMLVEAIKLRNQDFQLSLNRTYLDLFSSSNSIVPSCEKETAFKEIKILGVNQYIAIDKIKNDLSVKTKSVLNSLVSLGTEGGLILMDHWAYKWKSIYKCLKDNHQLLNLQISGGFDSRCTLALLYDQIREDQYFNLDSSVNMKDDYTIASSISEKLGLKLNLNSKIFKSKKVMSTLTWKIQNYFRFGFNHEILTNIGNLFDKPKFTFCGNGAAHSWYTDSTDKYIKRIQDGFDPIISSDRSFFADNISQILSSTFSDLDKYSDYKLSHSKNFLNFHFLYGRSKYSDGTSMSMRSCFNEYLMSPFMDAQYFKFNPIFADNSDYNLIPALIMTRYCPQLLPFEFTGNHKIEESTLKLALELNHKYPPSKYLKTDDYEYNFVAGFKSHNDSIFVNDPFTTDSFLLEYLSEQTKYNCSVALESLKAKGRHYNRLAYTYYQIVEILNSV